MNGKRVIAGQCDFEGGVPRFEEADARVKACLVVVRGGEGNVGDLR